EMIINPSVLFLDEPTSGLDTFTAFSVIRTLKALASTGRTVVATIHQPSSEIFHLFDDLVLMAEGRIAYQGDAEACIDYFAQRGYPCPDFTNPADFLFMSILNNEELSGVGRKSSRPVESNKDRISRLLKSWDESSENLALRQEVERRDSHGISVGALKVCGLAYFPKEFARYISSCASDVPPAPTNTRIPQRASRNAFRNPLIVKAKFGQSIIIALIIGIIYLNSGNLPGYAASQNRNGVLFFLSVNNVMSSCIGVLSIFGLEKIVFQREYGAGYYTLAAYFMSKVMVEMPFQIVPPWLGLTIVYWMVGLQNDIGKYFIIVLFVVLSAVTGFTLGIFFASIFSTLETALATAPLVLLPLMLFSGLFVNAVTIPAFFAWIKYISPIKYAYEAMVKSEYSGLHLQCQSANKTILTSDECIEIFGLNDGITIEYSALALLAMVVFTMSLGYAALYRLAVQNDK
ncbi:ABC-2 type transporter-domain-containing protein, partial [Blyttiomyces helicus]